LSSRWRQKTVNVPDRMYGDAGSFHRAVAGVDPGRVNRSGTRADSAVRIQSASCGRILREMANVLRAGQLSILSPELLALFGADSDTMEHIDARARSLYPERPPIVWECDARSFQFAYVGAGAAMLGYPGGRWLEPMFWADQVVHQDDREDAITYCALATAKARDHMFEYRARAADGRLIWLRDFVKVIPGPDGAPARLRGVMFDVSEEKAANPAPAARIPTRAELVA
jgi:PAS domain-containing protein